ncbi:MAG: ATP-binding cassette domain-containing protein, partial [Anaerotignum sp.]|nr:ATP-binding cassette domain-containing protein [Anaerotignum sp.]
MSEPIIILEGVEKRFGNNLVVKNLDLEVAEGEFLTLLGPSGCGKTTTLRMIAGFEEASAGTIKVEGERVENIMGVLRGFFQGLGTMVPSAISQVIEQIVNAVVSVMAA